MLASKVRCRSAYNIRCLSIQQKYLILYAGIYYYMLSCAAVFLPGIQYYMLFQFRPLDLVMLDIP